MLFWAWVLGGGQRNVRIIVAGQELVFDARLVEIELPVGVANDQTPIAEKLEEEDPDTELGEPDAAATEATLGGADAADAFNEDEGGHRGADA